MTAQTLSKACRTAIIIDTEAAASYRYADLYTTEAAKPIPPRGGTLGDIFPYRDARTYLVSWEDATVRILTRKALGYIKPEEIDKLYKRAKRLTPTNLDEGKCV